MLPSAELTLQALRSRALTLSPSHPLTLSPSHPLTLSPSLHQPRIHHPHPLGRLPEGIDEPVLDVIILGKCQFEGVLYQVDKGKRQTGDGDQEQVKPARSGHAAADLVAAVREGGLEEPVDPELVRGHGVVDHQVGVVADQQALGAKAVLEFGLLVVAYHVAAHADSSIEAVEPLQDILAHHHHAAEGVFVAGERGDGLVAVAAAGVAVLVPGGFAERVPRDIEPAEEGVIRVLGHPDGAFHKTGAGLGVVVEVGDPGRACFPVSRIAGKAQPYLFFQAVAEFDPGFTLKTPDHFSCVVRRIVVNDQ